MQSKELVNFRIGNYLLDTNKNQVVKMDFGTFESIHYCRYQMYVPIKLSFELLLNFGFKHSGFGGEGDWQISHQRMSLKTVEIEIDKQGVIRHKFPNFEIECVHELQNFFFASTGEELELKSETKS